ncbi:MAG TPA: hypothetical protein VGM95_07015 [Lactobacillaceae bacterium]|jgi:hypothetical protein
MLKSEKEAIDVMEKAFTDQELWSYVFVIQDYFAFDTDQLETESSKFDDHLQDVIPEFTEAYDNTKADEWLAELRKIIDHAKILLVDNQVT